MKKSKLTFELLLDENNVPIKIIMDSNDKQLDSVDVKSLMVSAWDAVNKETLKIDLWTKEMMVEEMYILYHQTLMSMASTLQKSTGHEKLSDALRDYCDFFAKQTKIINSKKS